MPEQEIDFNAGSRGWDLEGSSDKFKKDRPVGTWDDTKEQISTGIEGEEKVRELDRCETIRK